MTKAELKQEILDNIKPNARREITGQKLQKVLLDSVDVLGTESDPIFMSSPAADITDSDITAWNSKASGAEVAELREDVEANTEDIEDLQAAYVALTETNVVPLAEADFPVANPEENTIYRVAGVSSYSDYMWNGTEWVLLKTYNNGIDTMPTQGSHNFVESGGVKQYVDEFFGAPIPVTPNVEQGSIKTSDGTDEAETRRLRTIGFIDAGGLTITITNGRVIVFGYRDDESYIGSTGTWASGTINANITGATKYRIAFSWLTNATIVPDDYPSLGCTIGVVNHGRAVQIVPQSLTDSEKSTARDNIGAADAEELANVADAFTEGSRVVTEEVPFTPVAGYVNKSGSSGGASSYVNTGEISVNVGDVVSLFNQDGVCSMRFVAAKSGSSFQSTLGAENVTSYIVPSGVDAVVLSTSNANDDGTLKYKRIYHAPQLQLKNDALDMDSTPTEDSDKPVTSGGVAAALANPANVLSGKKWVACGDSFTHGDFANSESGDYIITSGRYAGEYKVYPFLIGNRNNMDVINEAINGSCLTHITGRTNAFSDTRYQNIAADADYITIKIGINDDANHQNVPIGTINDATNSTFYGAWNVVLDYLIRNHPQAKIGIIVTNGATLDIVNATIAICQKWGIAYLNEATDEHCSFMFRSNRTGVVAAIRSFRDNYWHVSNTEGARNYHPNEKAHEYESAVVEAWLRTL